MSAQCHLRAPEPQSLQTGSCGDVPQELLHPQREGPGPWVAGSGPAVASPSIVLSLWFKLMAEVRRSLPAFAPRALVNLQGPRRPFADGLGRPYPLGPRVSLHPRGSPTAVSGPWRRGSPCCPDPAPAQATPPQLAGPPSRAPPAALPVLGPHPVHTLFPGCPDGPCPPTHHFSPASA